MTTIDRYIQDFSAMLGLAPECVRPEPYDCIGEQLGRAIAPMIEDLASVMYDLAKRPVLSHMPEGEVFDGLVKAYLRESKRKTSKHEREQHAKA